MLKPENLVRTKFYQYQSDYTFPFSLNFLPQKNQPLTQEDEIRAQEEASKIVSSVLATVNNKLSSGEIVLATTTTQPSTHNAITADDSCETVTTIANTVICDPSSNKSVSFQSKSAIPELEEAIKSISDRIERILSPPNDNDELLEQLRSQVRL